MIRKFMCAALIGTFILAGVACGKKVETEKPSESVKQTEGQDSAEETESLSENFDFSTEDIDGNNVSFKDLDAKLIMVNFWEPWCGPCIGEMPDLEELYAKYKDQGFVILGVFSTEGVDEDVRTVIEENKITYPILRVDEKLAKYMQDYVPATMFVDGSGKVLSETPYIGVKTADAWEEIIKSYLK